MCVSYTIKCDYTFSICKTRDFIKFIENKVDTCEVFHCSGGNMEKPDFSIKDLKIYEMFLVE